MEEQQLLQISPTDARGSPGKEQQAAGVGILLQIMMLVLSFVLGHVLRRHRVYYLPEASASLLIVNQGLEQAHGTGYGGSGFKFNEEEDEVRRTAKKAQAKEYGFEEDKSDSKDEDEGIRKAGADVSQQVAALAQAAAFAAANKANGAQLPADLGGWTSIVVEKPFGRDLASAEDLSAQIG